MPKYFHVEWLFRRENAEERWWRFGIADTLADAKNIIRREMCDPRTAMRDARIVQVAPKVGAFDLREVYRWTRRRERRRHEP